MTPRPLHRSLTFWSGILVMASILWAWWDSGKYISRVTFKAGRVVHTQAWIAILTTPNMASRPSPVQRDPMPAEGDPTARLLPRPVFARGGAPLRGQGKARPAGISDSQLALIQSVWACPPGWTVTFIPHWLILLGVALPWSALLVWRARRHRGAGKPVLTEAS